MSLSEFAVMGVAPSVVVSGATWAAARMKDRMPERHRWRLTDPERVGICLSKRERKPPVPPSTGLGQTIALGIIAPSLAKAYPGIAFQSVCFADQVRHETDDDLILLGGPKNNALAAEVCEYLAARTGVALGTTDLRFPDEPDPIPHEHDEPLTQDYGVVARIESPWSGSRRTVLMFAGCHTFGTTAAARYFVENVRPMRKRYRGPFVAVALSQVRNDHVKHATEAYFARID